MSKYDINYPKLATLLLPVCLRGGALNALVGVLMAPLGLIKSDLLSYRAEKDYRLTHNSQTCYMRAVLNDRFDPVERGITITENETSGDDMTLYKRETERWKHVPLREQGRLVLFRRGLGGSDRVGFWINIPQRLETVVTDNLVRAVVNVYKLACVRYGITYNH